MPHFFAKEDEEEEPTKQELSSAKGEDAMGEETLLGPPCPKRMKKWIQKKLRAYN